MINRKQFHKHLLHIIFEEEQLIYLQSSIFQAHTLKIKGIVSPICASFHVYSINLSWYIRIHYKWRLCCDQSIDGLTSNEYFIILISSRGLRIWKKRLCGIYVIQYTKSRVAVLGRVLGALCNLDCRNTFQQPTSIQCFIKYHNYFERGVG